MQVIIDIGVLVLVAWTVASVTQAHVYERALALDFTSRDATEVSHIVSMVFAIIVGTLFYLSLGVLDSVLT